MENTGEKKETSRQGKTKRLRTILVIVLLVFIVMQFFQPDKNNNDVLAKNDIGTMVTVPDTVQQLLKVACYDCHSNNTIYPWYTNLQPVGWWMEHHINEGKEHLNFNEFTNISPRNGHSTREIQMKKLEDIRESIEEGEMPLSSYLWIHTNARLNKEQQHLITVWADSARLAISKLHAQ